MTQNEIEWIRLRLRVTKQSNGCLRVVEGDRQATLQEGGATSVLTIGSTKQLQAVALPLSVSRLPQS